MLRSFVSQVRLTPLGCLRRWVSRTDMIGSDGADARLAVCSADNGGAECATPPAGLADLPRCGRRTTVTCIGGSRCRCLLWSFSICSMRPIWLCAPRRQSALAFLRSSTLTRSFAMKLLWKSACLRARDTDLRPRMSADYVPDCSADNSGTDRSADPEEVASVDSPFFFLARGLTDGVGV